MSCFSVRLDANTARMPRCSQCSEERAKSEFSKSQLKKGDRRCKKCVSSGVPLHGTQSISSAFMTTAELPTCWVDANPPMPRKRRASHSDESPRRKANRMQIPTPVRTALPSVSIQPLSGLTRGAALTPTTLIPAALTRRDVLTSRADLAARVEAASRRVAPRNHARILPQQLARIDEAVRNHDVTIVQGETGCGKSTVLPVHLLGVLMGDDMTDARCRIAVTQPRRIAATAIAQRVAEQMGVELGGKDVGVQIGLENLSCAGETRLLFMTAGVLLEQLRTGGAAAIASYRMLIIDEVHERSVESDLVLGMIRDLLARRDDAYYTGGTRDGTHQFPKLLLMSATFDYKRYQEFFEQAGASVSMCMIRSGSSMLRAVMPETRVRIKYLEDAEQLLRGQGVVTAPIERVLTCAYGAPVSASDGAATLKAAGGKLDSDWHALVTALVLALDRCEPDHTRRFLVFLPTYADLEAQHAALSAAAVGLEITALHSSVNVHECVAAMDAQHMGRRVFVATNIAESSVTIRDVSVVIDTCRALQVSWDDTSGRTESRVVWCSDAACAQRAGRTGRTGPGDVFRLLPRTLYKQLAQYEPAQLLLSGLHAEFLKLASVRDASINPATVLRRCLDPPPDARVHAARGALVRLGALEIDRKGAASATRFGQMLASLPVSLDFGWLIIAGARRGYLREASLLAALSATSPRPIMQRLNEHARYEQALTRYSGRGAASGTTSHDQNSILFANLAAVLHYENGWRRELAARRLCERVAAHGDDSWSASSIAEIEDELGLGVRSRASPPSTEELEWCEVREISAASARRVLDTADVLLEALEKRAFSPAFLKLNRALAPETGRSEVALSDLLGSTRVNLAMGLLASCKGVVASGDGAAEQLNGSGRMMALCRYLNAPGGCQNVACHFRHPGRDMDAICWPPLLPVPEAARHFTEYGIGSPVERLLILGDGDFTYADAAAKTRVVLAATSLLSRRELEATYGADAVSRRLVALRKAGAFVVHGVDATNLADVPPALFNLRMHFDRVVWNFPSAPSAEDGDDNANATMLARFFLSLTNSMLRQLVAPGCALTLTLQGDQYSRWRVGSAARTAFWRLTRVCAVPPEQPYTPCRAESATPIPMDGSARRYEFHCCLAALARKSTDQRVPLGVHIHALAMHVAWC